METKQEENSQSLSDNSLENQMGENRYKCETCGMTFKLKFCLKQHQNIHTGLKSYRCQTCEKCFTQLRNLKSHEKIHTGERPYQCATCLKTFTYSTQ